MVEPTTWDFNFMSQFSNFNLLLTQCWQLKHFSEKLQSWQHLRIIFTYLVLFWAAISLSLGETILLIFVGTGKSDREVMLANSDGDLVSINCFLLANSSKSVISLLLVTRFWVLQDLGRVLYILDPSLTFGSNSTSSLNMNVFLVMSCMHSFNYCSIFQPKHVDLLLKL